MSCYAREQCWCCANGDVAAPVVVLLLLLLSAHCCTRRRAGTDPVGDKSLLVALATYTDPSKLEPLRQPAQAAWAAQAALKANVSPVKATLEQAAVVCFKVRTTISHTTYLQCCAVSSVCSRRLCCDSDCKLCCRMCGLPTHNGPVFAMLQIKNRQGIIKMAKELRVDLAAAPSIAVNVNRRAVALPGIVLLCCC